MSRSCYVEDLEPWDMIRWRGAVKSASRGRRGQVFFKELLAAMDAMQDKKLITDELESNGNFCALGVLGHARQLDMSKIDPTDSDLVSKEFNIAAALAREVVFMNDEYIYQIETPEKRWARMRRWIVSEIRESLPLFPEATPM